jgi:Cys-tRNA(Pro) deacylase
MTSDLPAIQELTRREINFRVFQHPGEVTSLEQAARERDQTPEQVIRSILFRLAADEYVMVLMPGPRQISWKALRSLLNLNRVTMASDEELLAVTGYRPGTVTPLGLPGPLRILADRSLLALPEVSLGSGRRGIAIILSPAELRRAIPGLEIVDL